jgi:hypothetical protein
VGWHHSGCLGGSAVRVKLRQLRRASETVKLRQ